MIVVTGANGNLGQRLLRELSSSGTPLRALVRSAAAAEQLRALALTPAPEIVEVDYLSVAAMTAALAGATAVVHLVGIIKESRRSSYRAAHEGTAGVLCDALARAAEAPRVIYLSILGSSPGSANPCLASKGRAEERLLRAALPALVLRVPMVLGEGDHASAALAARASRKRALVLRASSLEQPIYAGDVTAAVRRAIDAPAAETPTGAVDLAGPESLTRAALTERAAAALGRRCRVWSLPLGLGLFAAAVLERVSADPPVTRAMLGVLDHDDAIDPAPAAARLGIALTPLDETLRRVLTGVE